MSDQLIQQPNQSKWWKKKDVKLTAFLTVVFSAIVGVVGTTFHTYFMPEPASETMAEVIRLIRVFTWAASPVVGIVGAMSVVALLTKSHYGDNPPPEAEHSIRNSPRAGALWVVISSILCLFAVITGLVVLQEDSKAILEDTAIEVNVTGQQWVWNFDYANGARSNVLYLPVDKPVIFNITSVDVKHSFWVVQMGIKMDANPGYTTQVAVTPNKIGVFDIRCAELCGLLHAYMQNKVHVVSQAEYDQWLKDQAAFEGAGA
jgi:cytochrome c oxidase subunit 2